MPESTHPGLYGGDPSHTYEVDSHIEPRPETQSHAIPSTFYVSYAELEALFGPPHAMPAAPPGERKSDVMWRVIFRVYGHPSYLAIVNYKDGPAYLGPEGVHPRDRGLMNWDVGATSADCFGFLASMLLHEKRTEHDGSQTASAA